MALRADRGRFFSAKFLSDQSDACFATLRLSRPVHPMMKILLVLFSFLASVSAQDSGHLYLSKADGGVVSGSLVSLKGDQVVIKTKVLGGSHSATYHLSDFSPASAWRLEKAANPPSDFASHFALAKKAAGYGLETQAGNEARAALKQAKGTPEYEADRKAVHAWAAEALEVMVDRSLKEGDLKSAQHYLNLLTTRMADIRSEQQLHAVAARVEAVEDAKKSRSKKKRDDRMNKREQETITRHLKPIQDQVDRADAKYKEAVRKSGSTTQSSNLCEDAIRRYKSAWKSLQKLMKEHPDDKHLAMVGASLGNHIHDNAIRAALHAASVLTTQSDYKNAMKWARKVLEFEPDNADAKRMVSTIQNAEAESSDDWRYGWRITDGSRRQIRRR
jgi:tetratricopeptide (TPR) repeat protein